MDDVEKLAKLAEKMKALEDGLSKRATRQETLDALLEVMEKEVKDRDSE